jgi:transcriptional regulator with XRE-family HTH domain
MSLAPADCVDDRPDPVGAGGHPATATKRQPAPLLPPGRFLRQQREERGLSLDDVSRATKINKATLHAIEATDVQHLPATIYTRGFVKAYAREVGLDPEWTADEYLRAIEPLRSAPLDAGDDLLHHTDVFEPVDTNRGARALLAENQMRLASRVTFALAVIGLVVYIASFYRTDPSATPPPDEAVATDAGDAARASGVGAAPDNATDAAPAASGAAAFRLELVPQGPCWVSARVDGGRVVARLMKAGERQTLEISDEVVIRVGEPGALSFSINGQSGRPFGPPGRPITVRITKDNFRDFLIS